MPILELMHGLIALLILAAVALLLRKVLHMDVDEGSEHNLLGSLSRDLHPLYSPLAQEIETQITILGITLNDAFGEREAGQHELSWHVIRLTRGEWDRLGDLVTGLQGVLAKFLPLTHEIAILRRIAIGNFKSRTMRDHVRMYEFLDQLTFSSKRRFGLQLRLLSRSRELLNNEFQRTSREGARSLDSSIEMWTRLDFLFHDFDLISKETLLAFRTMLACQTPERAQELAAELQELLRSSSRVAVTLQKQ